jgi:hypothetical protein
MNILWIEDFDKLDPGTATLNLMFQDLISFDNWDEDEQSLLSQPSDLEKFFKENSALHCVFLCRHYFDYVDFKTNKDLTKGIDAVIIDIRLDNKVDFNDATPSGFNDKAKFHQEAGFYIFNDLVHLGFPAEKMCFMTGEKNSFDTFKTRCSDIYIPEVVGFEKSNAEYGNLRQWIKERESDYEILRHGVIEGCQYLKKLNQPPTSFNQFQESGKETNLDEMHDYLQILENFLPLREPDDKATCYKLFLRTLTHEWESAKPEKIKGLAWIMKSTRNWITHNSNLFNALDEKMLAYLFIINVRVMFDFDKKFESYEKILLNLFATDALTEQLFKDKSKNKLIPIGEAYCDIKNLALDNNVKDAFVFSTIANNIQESNSAIRHDKQLFSKLLYQMFWLINSYPRVDTKNRKLLEINFSDFYYVEKTYLFELARHIYNRSFP